MDIEIRKIVCSTNAIESVNARIRRAVPHVLQAHVFSTTVTLRRVGRARCARPRSAQTGTMPMAVAHQWWAGTRRGRRDG
ncbi:transposase [Actinoplanes bogorensis]|uniref:Transposase n=1 Tax=Paractinoplanes bogorensis TaxID=1610840 RepID=A0ABS5YX52_9ACTN|nr:transposase [Actinoplanes bogorensis]